MNGIRSWTATCGDDMPIFVAVPDHVGKAPAVIVVHERYGLVRHTRDLAERFARDGFVAVAPDLFFKHPDQERPSRDAICDADPDARSRLGAAIDALKTILQPIRRLAPWVLVRPAGFRSCRGVLPGFAALVGYGAARRANGRSAGHQGA
jgi:dienelactone hydrolase